MMVIKRASYIATIALLLAGCNSQITDYVKGVHPDNLLIPDTSVKTSSPMELKRSPGSMNAAGTNAAVKANITASNKTLSGNGVAAKVSISRARPSP